MFKNTDQQKNFAKVPGQVWALGFVSFFSDLSTEMIYGILPIFLKTVLGATTTQLGFMEGMAEGISMIIKMFSGLVSDWFKNRKWLTAIGYGIAALSKPLFPLANSYSTVFAARMMDRAGKGIRGAPRDALIADHSSAENRGASFGLRQSMDNAGAVLGPLIALGLLIVLHKDIRSVMWISIVPIWISVLLLIFVVKESKNRQQSSQKKFKLSDVKKFSKAFWLFQLIVFIMMLSKCSDVFLVLKAQEMGWKIGMVPIVMVIMNAVYTFSTYPVGRWSDRVARYKFVPIGIALFIFSDVVLASANNNTLFVTGIILWGLYLGFTQGVLSAMVVDLIPVNLRGTGIGIFQCVSGIALLIASSGAGYLWDHHGSKTMFITSGTMAFISLVCFVAYVFVENRKIRIV